MNKQNDNSFHHDAYCALIFALSELEETGYTIVKGNLITTNSFLHFLDNGVILRSFHPLNWDSF